METTVKTAKRVGKYVNTAHVDEVIKNYKRERWVHNSERIGKEDSLSSWWSIAEMEDFIATAKMHGADGLKFYYGAYSSNYSEVPEYADRQTLVMVATKEKTLADGVKNKDIYIQGDTGTTILAYNKSGLCPPKCGGLDPNGLDNEDLMGVTIVDRGSKGMIII